MIRDSETDGSLANCISGVRSSSRTNVRYADDAFRGPMAALGRSRLGVPPSKVGVRSFEAGRDGRQQRRTNLRRSLVPIGAPRARINHVLNLPLASKRIRFGREPPGQPLRRMRQVTTMARRKPQIEGEAPEKTQAASSSRASISL